MEPGWREVQCASIRRRIPTPPSPFPAGCSSRPWGLGLRPRDSSLRAHGRRGRDPGPDAVPLQLKVNGVSHTVTVKPRVTLLRALRNHLDLTGAKEICDRGACGGCTVLFDGEPICACLMLAVDAVGHEITTVEGLGTPEKLSPVQAAFVECDALQCGFCTPGFVVASTALLNKHPNPSLEEIKTGLAGNLCRCGTYSRIFEAVQQAAKRRG